MSTLADSMAARDQLPSERRFYPRITPRVPIPVAFPEPNVTAILNLSENGILVSSSQALVLHSVHRVALVLGNSVPISVHVHTVWSDPAWQKSGLQFLDLTESDRNTLRHWAEEQLSVAKTSVCAASSSVSKSAEPAKATESQSLRRTTGAGIPSPERWLSALEHHRRIPVRYFWAGFAATLLLGATWAAVEGFLPDKIVKSPIEHLRSARRPPDSAPALAPTPPPTVAPAQSASRSALHSSPETSHPLAPSSPARASTVLRAQPQPPLLNPRPALPNPAPTTRATTQSEVAAQPVPVPPPAAAPRSAAPTAPVPARIAPMPAYSTQFLEIPSMPSSAYVQLPGERVLRSPSLTMHIQRSVWVKASHWFWHSRKKVDLGELAAHTEPRIPPLAPGAAKPTYGSVTVLASIGKDGKISSVRPLYGSAQLLPNVSAALRGWRYQPTYVDGQPSETLARIEVDFHAQQRSDGTFGR